MLHLVSYDIPSGPAGDRRRSRLARKLEGIGVRVQNSVFELDIDPQSLPRLTSDLGGCIDETCDNLRIYPVCGTCGSKILRIGIEAVIERDPLVVW